MVTRNLHLLQLHTFAIPGFNLIEDIDWFNSWFCDIRIKKWSIDGELIAEECIATKPQSLLLQLYTADIIKMVWINLYMVLQLHDGTSTSCWEKHTEVYCSISREYRADAEQQENIAETIFNKFRFPGYTKNIHLMFGQVCFHKISFIDEATASTSEYYWLILLDYNKLLSISKLPDGKRSKGCYSVVVLAVIRGAKMLPSYRVNQNSGSGGQEVQNFV